MALRIIKSEEVIKVEQLVTVLYGAPGLGKSTLGFTAESPLMLDFDHGAHRAANRMDSVKVESWTEIDMITPSDLTDYSTIIIDTAGRALDFLSADIIKRNQKMGRSGALTLQGYGQLKSRFTGWLNSLKLLGKDVVLIAHASEERNGDEVVERLDVQGGSKGELYKSADAMGRLTMLNGNRILSFSPSDAAFGKNPGCLPSLNIPDITDNKKFLAEQITAIKKKLNAITEEQRLRMDIISEWKSKFDSFSSIKDYNNAISTFGDEQPEISKIVKAEMHRRALDAGYKFNTDKGEYECEE